MRLGKRPEVRQSSVAGVGCGSAHCVDQFPMSQAARGRSAERWTERVEQRPTSDAALATGFRAVAVNCAAKAIALATIRARMNPRIWRIGHRWLGFVAALFLLFAGTTGVLVAMTEFFGEDEAERERLRDVVSSVTTDSPLVAWTEPLQRALATVAVCTGLPAGGEDRRYVLDARTGTLLADEAYVDKPFLYRLHSGEAFGDGGLVGAMLWGTALVLLAISGLVVYWQMRRPGATGWKRVFW